MRVRPLWQNPARRAVMRRDRRSAPLGNVLAIVYLKDMQRLIRSFTALFMALTLVFTAQTMASARSMTSATGEMILCTGTGPVAIQFDADGNPTGPPHICPDCAMSFLSGTLPECVAQIVRLYQTTAPMRPDAVAVPPSHNRIPMARGPPVSI